MTCILHSCDGGKSFLGIGKSFTDLDSFVVFAQKMNSDSSNEEVYKTYQLNNFQPVWLDKTGPKPFTKKLLSELQSLQKEGIILDTVLNTVLQKAVLGLDSIDQLDAAKAFSTDSLILAAYHQAGRQLLFGSKPSPKAEQWFVENDTAYYGPQHLAAWTQDSFPAFDTFRPMIPDYAALLQEIDFWENALQDSAYLTAKKNPEEAGSLALIFQKEIRKQHSNDTLLSEAVDIKTYQEFFGLNASGKIDPNTKTLLQKMPEQHIQMLQTNLDRLRRMPRDIGQHFVWVNIPLMELVYYRDGQAAFEAPVIVGTSVRPTPSISSPMTQIVFNPPWGVPPTIMKNDIAPGVARSGGAYLARKGLRAYDRKGRDVTAQVNGSNIRNYHISQPPGAGNALGDIKFNMPNDEAIYIHDTPNRGLFGQKNRALSSGCVRTQNPRILAEKILNADSFSLDRIGKIIDTRKTKIHNLQNPLPVYIIYLTAAIDPETKRIRYFRDIYGRDQKKKK